jgi:hypothetical protein
MQIESVFTKDLKKGDKVLNYGATFLILEDAYNRGQQVEFLSNYTIENNDQDIWIAKCKFVSGASKEDGLLRNYDTFQSNSLQKCWSRIIE